MPWLACPASPLSPMEQAESSGAKGGQGASRWLCDQVLSYVSRGLKYLQPTAPALPRSARASGAAFWPRSPPSEKRAPPASHPSGAAAWPAPKPVVVIGGAPEEIGLLILDFSDLLIGLYSKSPYDNDNMCIRVIGEVLIFIPFISDFGA
jgi:hypothetical protein